MSEWTGITSLYIAQGGSNVVAGPWRSMIGRTICGVSLTPHDTNLTVWTEIPIWNSPSDSLHIMIGVPMRSLFILWGQIVGTGSAALGYGRYRYVYDVPKWAANGQDTTLSEFWSASDGSHSYEDGETIWLPRPSALANPLGNGSTPVQTEEAPLPQAIANTGQTRLLEIDWRGDEED